MAILLSSIPSRSVHFPNNDNFNNNISSCFSSVNSGRRPSTVASHVCSPDAARVELKKAAVRVSEGVSEEELWAAACLRVRSFYRFKEDTFAIQGSNRCNLKGYNRVPLPYRDHKKYLAEREFEALKERIAGKRSGFLRVSCINATLSLSHLLNYSEDLCSECKYSEKGEDRVVIGTLDINQCIRLPDEITGKRPQGVGADFARAYLSNVCVAKELQRNGLGYMLVSKSKEVAEDWGISDLYVHVAIDNEPAKILYMKSGFVYENDEPAWQARFLDRPRRILLWTEIPNDLDL